MADQYVQVQPDSTGKKIDVAELTVNSATVERQRVAIGDNSTAANYLAVNASGQAAVVVGNAIGSGVPVQADEATTTSGTITTSTSTVSASVSGYSHIGVSISGTYAGVNVTFEFSDNGGTTWFVMQMTRSDSSIVESVSGVLTSNLSRAWDATVPSCTNFRVRATAYTSGTANIRIIPSAFPCVFNVAGNIRLTDATAAFFMPPMDIASRKGFHAITDGTNTAAVKAASTAAAATDPSIVVNISPNSPAHPVFLKPQTTGGTTQHKLVSAATTNATSVKTSAGQLYSLQVFNNGAAAAYLKFSNLATAPTVGTTAVTKSIMIPAGGGAVIEWTNGVPFATGIAYCVTTNPADSDTTAIAASQVIVNLDYA